MIRTQSALLASLLLATVAPSRGAVYTVSTLDDNLTVDARCSLREAVFLHNGFSAANDCGIWDTLPDSIGFSATGVLLIDPALGEFVVRAPALAVEGPGASALALDGQGAVPILALDAVLAAPLTVRGLTLQHGAARDQGPDCTGGGAIRGHACGSPTDDLTIEDVVFLENSARRFAGLAVGGAIRGSGRVVIRRSRFLRNSADGFGAIRFDGSLQVEESTFEENVGGTILVFINGHAGSAIRTSLFRRNHGDASASTGSLAAAVAVGAGGSMLLENSTFQGNQATNGQTIVGAFTSFGTMLTVRNCTFAENGAAGTLGAVLAVSGAENPLELRSSLFSRNAGPDVTTADGAAITSAFNLFGSVAASLPPGTACAASTAGGANLCGIAAAGLAALAANGGPTPTMALAGASPAIDAGANPGLLVTDQRGAGFPRTRGAATDIGAFESTPTTVYVVDSLADERAADGWCTLREALDAHNGVYGWDCGSPDAVDDRIVFADGLSGTIALEPDLGSFLVAPPALEIAGPGAEILAIDGQGATSILLADGAGTRLTVRGLTLRHGHAIAQGYGLAMGGAIRFVTSVGTDATLTVEDAVFADNTAPFTVTGEAPGFGAAIATLGTLRIRRSRFERNQGGVGGAVYHVGAFSVEDSDFVANRAEHGAALWLSAAGTSVVVSRSLLRDNTASLGAAIEISGAKVSLRNTTFAGNRGAGGAVLDAGPNADPVSLNVYNTTWYGNRASIGSETLGADAGVIVLRSGADGASSLNLRSSLFFGNQAPVVLAPKHAVLEGAFNLFDSDRSELPAEFLCDGSTVGGANLCAVEDAGLGPLTPNGGWTQTIPLRPHSLALDAGDNRAGLATDQRGSGYLRTAGTGTDIGAYELQTAGCPAGPPHH